MSGAAARPDVMKRAADSIASIESQRSWCRYRRACRGILKGRKRDSRRISIRHAPSRTISSYHRMLRMLQIRNVPNDLHARLKARAAYAGMSMSNYVLREIRQSLDRPTRQEVWLSSNECG